MTTRYFLASLAAATAITLTSTAFAADSAQQFVNKAAIGGMFEVESSKAAEGKFKDQAVKDFAQKMVSDHGAANAKLETIAVEQKLSLPKELDAAHKSNVEKLQNSEGEIDAPYIEMQRAAHSDAVTLFESFAKDGDNDALKAFAQETVPTLKMHQEMVETLAKAEDDKSAADSKPATDASTPAVAEPDAQNAAAPVPGANSFTEDQAKGRIQDAGYSDVSALTKDDQGIWRGTANKDGQSTAVALDYQGNVVAIAK